ncbi:microtubule-associated tumor suppressor candidate 2 [Corythoichthys intestinalis]|uniref:microtubule-associated tumor suppressor candidate 2 n=1 Tax=Corythoichthys intestinalis TaxID=161448 RepID=UPI0025A565E2|nr:microtubule-associated tumor suppressor candidate 2 [Corythoichthys intestinalis]
MSSLTRSDLPGSELALLTVAEMCERAAPQRNDNLASDAPSDGNANDIGTNDGGGSGVCGTPCDDPELAEFEMLECQELESYPAEDFVGLRERGEEPPPAEPPTFSRVDNSERILQPWVDLNWNSARDLASEAREQNQNNNQKNKAAKASPVRNATKTRTDESGSPRKAKSKQSSFDNSLKKQNSFERSFKKQISLEYTLKKQLSFDNSAKISSENSSRASSLERRKPWVNSGRPVKQLPASPAKVQNVQTPRSNLGCSGIPKPVAPLEKDSDFRRSSPSKNKNVRPKIITCVRKNPQGNLQGSNVDVSGHFEDHGKCPQEHPSRGARPQLGLGAVTRQPTPKTRVQPAAPKSSPGMLGQHGYREASGEQRRSGPESSPRNQMLKSGQTGLRPPGFSALPPPRIAPVGIMRSLSSMSSDSYACRTSQPLRKETLKESQSASPIKSSPKKCAVVSPKPQSLAHGRCGSSQEVDRALITLLRERCEQQGRQLRSLEAQLKKASLCMSVFSITTQHFCHKKATIKYPFWILHGTKSESAAVREGELSHELARIRDEVAFSVSHWEQLQREKQEAERRFQAELRGLRAEQRLQLGALEERLRAQHAADTRDLRALQRARLDDLRVQQREQMDEMNENHQASLAEMEAAHDDALSTLREEHARTVKNLKMAHEQQRKSLEEEFEKIRLSLQDQVDMLTFQNRSLRDRAKRFEEALRKSTDEQIVDALAPYKHIEEDLKSLKEVLEMKNQQIHEQDLKITELEKIQAEKNVHLEERVQVLQQQNEDLKERIDKNLAVSRQLSEENANLQVHVEKESTEKKRLSRTNEELLWRLQTGELSPRMSPSGSPVRQAPSRPESPARPHSCHQ